MLHAVAPSREVPARYMQWRRLAGFPHATCSSSVSRGSRMLHAVAPSRGVPACYMQWRRLAGFPHATCSGAISQGSRMLHLVNIIITETTVNNLVMATLYCPPRQAHCYYDIYCCTRSWDDTQQSKFIHVYYVFLYQREYLVSLFHFVHFHRVDFD